MPGTKYAKLRLIAVIVCSGALIFAARAGESPRDTLQAAIKAHGGEENLRKTLTGSLVAKAKVSFSPEVEASITWEETFELPRRYRRSIKGQLMGKDFSMEYAVTDDSGWIREDGGQPKDFKGQKLPLSGSWNAALALLPSYLADGVKLGPRGKDKVEGRDAVAVSVSGATFGGDAILYFDAKSGLLVKSKRRTQHPLTRQEVDGELILGDYKEVSSVQYPRRFTTFIDGKKAIEMEITRIELLKKLDDRLFEKP